MGRPHVLAIPYPAQGHVIPLMELAHCLARNSIKVTFVNSEFNHGRIMKAFQQSGNSINKMINLDAIPDGLEPWEDRNDIGKVLVAMGKIMPGKLEALIEKVNERESDKITCVISDYGLTWVFELAEKLGIKRSAFLPSSAAVVAFSNNAQKLADEGIFDSDGTPLKEEMIQLSPEMPAISAFDLVWTRIGDLTTQKIMFHSRTKRMESEKLMDWIVCNSSHELEPGALKLMPQCVPIGPLVASNRLSKSAGHFWAEDAASISWLDRQPRNSVIYVAFGSLTIFDEIQFQELAHGLELTNRPFLWVVRQVMIKETGNSNPEGFEERIKNYRKVVGWAPQQKVLSHPSVACFLSHCGWNSTIEGISNGVPFLCWPYFADQFINQAYISDYWKVGLSLDRDESGIVRRHEITKKVELLLTDKSCKSRALNLQSKAMSSATERGCSHKNFSTFVNWIKNK